MDKLALQYMLQSLELLEQNTVSQIRAMKGLLLAAAQGPQAERAATRVEEAFSTRDLEDRLGSWLADHGGMDFGEIDGIERFSESKTTDP